jgi:hypothetical protein
LALSEGVNLLDKPLDLTGMVSMAAENGTECGVRFLLHPECNVPLDAVRGSGEPVHSRKIVKGVYAAVFSDASAHSTEQVVPEEICGRAVGVCGCVGLDRA